MSSSITSCVAMATGVAQLDRRNPIFLDYFKNLEEQNTHDNGRIMGVLLFGLNANNRELTIRVVGGGGGLKIRPSQRVQHVIENADISRLAGITAVEADVEANAA